MLETKSLKLLINLKETNEVCENINKNKFYKWRHLKILGQEKWTLNMTEYKITEFYKLTNNSGVAFPVGRETEEVTE